MKRIMFVLTLSMLSACIVGGVTARDLDGRYAGSPLKPWFDQLASGKGLCCSMADGETVSDPDWESRDGHYRVRLETAWVDVPDTPSLPSRTNSEGPWSGRSSSETAA